MCVIVDANVVKGLLKKVDTAGGFLYSQIESRKLKLVVGGQKLRREYWKAGFGKGLVEAINAGLVRQQEDKEVDDRAAILARQHRAGTTQIRSDDYHILALAQISKARLLYSSDRDLHADFKNKDLIDNPSGKVYSTKVEEYLANKHRELLRERPCPAD